MDHFIVSFEDCRWPDLPQMTFAVEAENTARALRVAMARFRQTFPLENLAHYVAQCEAIPRLAKQFAGRDDD
jgi:hypothetical protein